MIIIGSAFEWRGFKRETSRQNVVELVVDDVELVVGASCLLGAEIYLPVSPGFRKAASVESAHITPYLLRRDHNQPAQASFIIATQHHRQTLRLHGKRNAGRPTSLTHAPTYQPSAHMLSPTSTWGVTGLAAGSWCTR